MNLPKYVVKLNGYYVYRTWNRKLRKHNKPVRLCSVDATYGQIISAYEQALGKEVYSLRTLFLVYQQSDYYQGLAISTRKQYEQCLASVENHELQNGLTLLDIPFHDWKRSLVRKYLDLRKAKIQANQEVRRMKAIFSWGVERDYCPENPCKGVKLNPEKPRTRYVEDWEFQLVYDLAKPRMKAAMVLAYKCRLRAVEVRNLTREDLTDEGIRCKRRKGSRTTIVQMDDDLRAATEWSKEISPYILHGYDRHQWRREAFNTEWQRLMRDAEKSGLELRFTFHDLKAKGITDDTEDKQRGAGHKSASMTSIYDRKPAVVRPIK